MYRRYMIIATVCFLLVAICLLYLKFGTNTVESDKMSHIKNIRMLTKTEYKDNNNRIKRIKKADIVQIRNIEKKLKTIEEPTQDSVYRDVYGVVLAERLQEKLGFTPSEEDIVKEIERLKEVVKRTEDYVFEMAADGFEELMKEQSRDSNWEEDVANYLQKDIVEHPEMNVEASEIDCTRRICKIRFEYSKLENQKNFVSGNIGRILNGVGGGHIYSKEETDQTGKLSTITYVTRQGDRLILLDLRDVIDQKLERQTSGEEPSVE